MQLQKHQDDELLKLARKADEQAFAALVTRHQGKVRRIVAGMIGYNSEVDDIAQEVFIRFYKSMDRFEGNAQLSTYLGRIAIRTTLTAIEKRKKYKNRFPFSLQEKDKTWSDGNRNIRQLDMKDAIQLALKQLSEDHRSVVVLRLVEGYSVEETAKMLSLPTGTVASRLSRAQLALRRILKPILSN